MSVIDIITRVDAICKKYDKYDVDKNKDSNVSGDDAFASLYGVVEADIEATLQKSAAGATEKNRASAVATNAEIRRTKACLFEELPKLQRLAFKKGRRFSKEELEARNDLVSALRERIEAIPDDGAKQTGGWTASTSYSRIRIDSTSGGRFDSEYYQQTEESDHFRQAYEIRRTKQDQGLDVIAQGLDTLKDMAHDMNEEVDRQMPLMDEIDDKVVRANADLKNANVKTEGNCNPGPAATFCIDIILLCIIFGIAAYLYNESK